MIEHEASEPPPDKTPLLLVEEINHRVINEYAEAISSLYVAARGFGPEGEAAVARAASRLRAHAQVHRALAPPVSAGRANLGDYIAELCASFSEAYLAERQVRITLTTDDVWLPAESVWRVGLILAELVRNALRHGLPKGLGTIAVHIVQGRDEICCVVADSGRADVAGHPGRGSRVVRAIAAELGGTVDWRLSESGSVVRLELPLPLGSLGGSPDVRVRGADQ